MGAVARAVLSARKSLNDLSREVKAISVLIVVLSLFGIYVPGSRAYISLIPGYTIKYPWNIITSSFIVPSLLELVCSIFVLIGAAQAAEPIYGAPEFCKLIFIAAVACGSVSFLLQYLPGVYVLLLTVFTLISGDLTALRFGVVGTFSGWLYLRFFKPSGLEGQRGDPSVDFALSTMCPTSVQPAFSALFTSVAKCFGVHREPPPLLPVEARDAAAMGAMVRAAGSEQDAPDWDASRRREMGRMALEARLAASGLSAPAAPSPSSTASPSRREAPASANGSPAP